MSDKDFEQILKDLREQYLEKEEITEKPSDSEKQEYYTPISQEEKRHKVLESLQLLEEKKLFLSQKLRDLYQQDASYEHISKLKHQIEALKYKHSLLQQKLEYIDSGESDFTKKEKLKRQLTELEIKRCRALLSKKSCAKIDQKINQKKELFKRIK